MQAGRDPLGVIFQPDRAGVLVQAGNLVFEPASQMGASMLGNRIPAFGVLLAVAAALLGGSATGDAQTRPLPPGHPPTGEYGSPPSVPAPAPGSGTARQALTWTLPSGWTEETPSSSMRRAQYRLPGPGGPAECVVFYFGPGQGGDAKSNATRWASQFHRADGGPVRDALKTREIKVGDIAVVTVEVTGTYAGGMGSGPAGAERPNYMLLGAIAQGPDANWFFRATGPRATLEAQRAAFDGLIRSLRRGQGS